MPGECEDSNRLPNEAGESTERDVETMGLACGVDPSGMASKGNHGKWLAMHCLGFGACWGWVHIAFFSTIFWENTAEPLSMIAWLVNVFANGCAMIALGIFSAARGPLRLQRGLVTALTSITVLGTIGLAFAQTAPDCLTLFASAMSGIGTAGLLLLWAEEYRNIPPAYAKRRTIPVSMAMGVLYFLAITLLPRIAAIAAAAFLPIISIVLLRKTFDTELKPEQAASSAQIDSPLEPVFSSGTKKHRLVDSCRHVVPIRFGFFVAVYCLAPGFMRGYSSALPFASTGGIGEAVFAGVAGVMIVIAVVSVAFFGETKIDLAYKLVVPLMAAGLLLLPFLASGREAVSAVAIMSGYILFEIYVWASLADRASNVDSPTALVYGLGKSYMNVGLLAGTFVGIYFGSSSSMLLVGALVFIVYLFIVMENASSPGVGVALSLEKAEILEDGGPLSARDKVTIVEAAQMNLSEAFNALLNERCSSAANEYHLSPRETEVLGLLARGRSLQAIADSLNVAYSTVKTHTDRIYAKMGVHSRQELIILLEQSPKE